VSGLKESRKTADPERREHPTCDDVKLIIAAQQASNFQRL
jgi:hypothetical protein